MSRKLIASLVAPLAAAALLFGLAACSTTGDSASAPGGGPTIEVNEQTVVIDVRTPAEFAAGHLEGAELIDFNAGEVAAKAATLDPEKEYFVYCRSGNRSAQAVAVLKAAGIEKVVDLGSMEAAAKTTGLQIVAD